MNVPAGETLGGFLTRRREELEAQISILRGQLVPREAELAQINKMRQLLADATVVGSDGLPQSNSCATPTLVFEAVGRLPPGQQVTNLPPVFEAVANLTIKQMILGALRDHFHEGATPAELREYFKHAYGREIDRTSISPQLTRMRDDGIIEQPPSSGEGGKWRLTMRGDLTMAIEQADAAAAKPKATDARTLTEVENAHLKRRL
jgi:hypothetical protein